jgi:outer membrane protein OmpA-like peptidoglycan-associated protein
VTEVALRYSSQTVQKLRQLPRWWQDEDTAELTSAESSPTPKAPASESVGKPPTTGATPRTLSQTDRDRIQAELTRLRQDLASLNSRLQTLETTLGEAPTSSLENRLQRLDQRLATGGSTDDGQTPEAAGSEPPMADPTAIANPVPLVPYQEPRFPLVSDRIILPSALLFEPGSSTLTAPGQQLLDSIAADLRRYGPVTLLVGSHTDPTIATDLASQLTLQQALAVQQHLAPQLEGAGARWVTLGYGYTRPRTTGATPAEQQRNQRVEIGVIPGS